METEIKDGRSSFKSGKTTIFLKIKESFLKRALLT